MDNECQQLLEQYSNSGDPHIADHLVECLDNARRARWEEMTSSLDFTHSRRKGWNLICKLSSGQQLPSSTRPSVTPNAVASHLVKVGKAPNRKSSETRDYKGMAGLEEAPAGRGDCNCDSHLSRGSRRSSQVHEVRQSSGIWQHPPRIPEKSGTKREEMAGNIANADSLGKEPLQELENYQNSRHSQTWNRPENGFQLSTNFPSLNVL